MQKSSTWWLRWFPILSRVSDRLLGLTTLRWKSSEEKPVMSEQDTMVENPVATRKCMPAFMKMRCETTYWARDRCHLQKVAYLRCSFLVLSASSCLYWKRSAPVGSCLRDYEWSVMPTDHLHLWSVIVIKRAEFDRWPHMISTSVGISRASILTWNYGIRMELHQQCCNKHTVQCTVDCTAVCVHMHDAGVDTV